MAATQTEANLILRQVFDIDRPDWESRALYDLVSLGEELPRGFMIVTGMGPKSAYEGAHAALEDLAGVEVGVGVGFCAGLHKTLHAGEVVLPKEVIFHGKKTEEATGGLRRSLLEKSQVPDYSLMSVESVITRAADKAAIFAATGVDAVDMESHAWLEALREKNIDRMMVRSILDTAMDDVPEEFATFVDVRGRVSYPTLLRSLFTRPSIVLDLWPYRPSILADRMASQSSLLRSWLGVLENEKTGEAQSDAVDRETEQLSFSYPGQKQP